MSGSKRGPMDRTPLFSILIFTSVIAWAFASSPQMPYKCSPKPKLSVNDDLHFIGSGLKLQGLPIDELLMILLEILKMEQCLKEQGHSLRVVLEEIFKIPCLKSDILMIYYSTQQSFL